MWHRSHSNTMNSRLCWVRRSSHRRSHCPSHNSFCIQYSWGFRMRSIRFRHTGTESSSPHRTHRSRICCCVWTSKHQRMSRNLQWKKLFILYSYIYELWRKAVLRKTIYEPIDPERPFPLAGLPILVFNAFTRLTNNPTISKETRVFWLNNLPKWVSVRWKPDNNFALVQTMLVPIAYGWINIQRCKYWLLVTSFK